MMCAHQPAVLDTTKRGVKKWCWNSGLVIGRSSKEVRIGVHFLVLRHDGLNVIGHLPKQRVSSRLFREFFRHALENRIAGITVLVDAMAKTHDKLLPGHHFANLLLTSLLGRNILKHV